MYWEINFNCQPKGKYHHKKREMKDGEHLQINAEQRTVTVGLVRNVGSSWWWWWLSWPVEGENKLPYENDKQKALQMSDIKDTWHLITQERWVLTCIRYHMNRSCWICLLISLYTYIYISLHTYFFFCTCIRYIKTESEKISYFKGKAQIFCLPCSPVYNPTHDSKDCL